MQQPFKYFVALLAFLAIATAPGASAADADCVVRLDINPATQLTFSGTSQASLMPSAFPVTVVDAGGAGAPKIGLSGSMYLRAAGVSTCPSTTEGWLAAADSLQLTTAPSGYYYKPLSVFPPTLPLEVMGVPLNISALQLNMTLNSKGPAPDTEATPFRMSVNATVTQGYVYSNTPLTGGPQLQPMAAVNSLSSSKALLNTTAPNKAGAKSSSSARMLNLVLPEFKLTFSSKSGGNVGGKPWTGTLTFSLTGGWGGCGGSVCGGRAAGTRG